MDFKTISSIWQWAYITNRAMRTPLTLNKNIAGAALVVTRIDKEEHVHLPVECTYFVGHESGS